MKLLIVSPDYASHVAPMVQIGRAWQHRFGSVIVATGDSVRASVEAEGLDWTHLRLGKGSNNGIIRAEGQPAGEDDHLREFFAATRAGAVETLRYQATARQHDLLFEPERVLCELSSIMAAIRPDRVLVDHVAFGARLALHALGVEAATIVLGHPTALPARGELYGLPPVWPSALQPCADELAGLRQICAESAQGLTSASNQILDRFAPFQPRLDDLTRLAGHPTIYNYPTELHDKDRELPARSVSIGALRRDEDLWSTRLPDGTGWFVMVALGTFLSSRSDILSAAVSAAHLGSWRLALASGSTPIGALGPLPNGAVVGEHLPQVALLRFADVLVTHGGNNSVTEACASGVPMVVLPMSTDQFAGARAIEKAGIGIVLDPNQVTAESLRDAVEAVLASSATQRIRELAQSIAKVGGAAAAAAAIHRQDTQ